MRTNRLVGVSIVFASVLSIIGVDVLHGLGIRLGGELAVWGATWSYAFAGIFGRRFSTSELRRIGVNPLVTAAGCVAHAGHRNDPGNDRLGERLDVRHFAVYALLEVGLIVVDGRVI